MSGSPFSDQRVAIAVAGADGPQGDDLRVVVFDHIGYRHRLWTSIPTYRVRAWSLADLRGWWCRFHPEAALVSGKLSGGVNRRTS